MAELQELKSIQENPKRPGYRMGCPDDQVLLIVYENRCDVLEYIGSGMDWISDNGMMGDYFDPDVEGMAPGVYLWSGKLRETQDPISQEYDSELDGTFRLATAEEWHAYLDSKPVWDEDLWYMPDDEDNKVIQ
jgi:hypothetical protein